MQWLARPARIEGDFRSSISGKFTSCDNRKSLPTSLFQREESNRNFVTITANLIDGERMLRHAMPAENCKIQVGINRATQESEAGPWKKYW
jgi:hypothetical protein